ncbi:MAG: RHS repeat-associated core domain-containing protein [Candidatus Acidiferrales bacterium]
MPNSINYAVGSCANGLSSNGVCYAPNGSVAQVQNGTNLVSTYLYNTRFQPCWMYATTGTALATNTSCTASESGTHATGTVTISGVEQKKCSSSAPVRTTSTSSPEAGCPIGEGYIYDSGDVSITVDGFGADAGYGQGSTASSIATSLISQLNASNSPVTATGGTTITLTSKATGTSANYTLSTSVSWDDGDFSSPSFRATPSGSTLTGGSGFGSGNILDLQYNFNLGSGDNGDVIGITNNRDTTRTQSFTYSALNRITTAQTQGTSGSNCFGFQFTDDTWANLTGTSILSGYTSCSLTTPYAFSITVNGNNQITTSGFSYDASGNLMNDGFNSYAYNAESEIKTAEGVTYTYDGDGNRIEKSNGKIYWYGAGTEILDESDTSGNITNEYVFFGGKRVAMRVVSSGTIYYYEGDMLGSARTMVQAGQTAPCFDADFLPYGQEVDFTSTCGSNYRFEGKERDLETGDDNFGARYYRSTLGRWLSADWSSIPAPVPYANLTNPQTLNLYAMVSDNPETFADLDGHQCGNVGSSDRNSCPKSVQTSSSATQGEGFPAPQKPGDGMPPQINNELAQQQSGYAETDNITHTLTISQTTTTQVVNQNGTTTQTSVTTNASWSTAHGQEEAYLGATQTTSTTVFSAGMTSVLSSSSSAQNISSAAAFKVLGAGSWQAGSAYSSPDRAAYFVRAVGSDIRAHPLKYAGIAAEAGLIATPVPEAYEGAKAIGDVVLAGAHLVWDLTH